MSKTLDFANVSYKAMKGVFPLWKDASSHTIRGMTRLLYDPVFCCGAVNQTGLTSVSALMEKTKPTLAHCLSPQFVARMIYDQPDIWLSEFDKFYDLFLKCCQTIEVTSKENNLLRGLTKNRDGKLTVKVPTIEKYNYTNIKLYDEDEGVITDMSKIFESIVPKELTEYEKQYLAS